MGVHNVCQAFIEVVSVVLLIMAGNRIELEDILVVLSLEDTLVEHLLVERSVEVEVVQEDVVAAVLKVLRLHLQFRDLSPRLELLNPRVDHLDLLGVRLCRPRLQPKGTGTQKIWPFGEETWL